MDSLPPLKTILKKIIIPQKVKNSQLSQLGKLNIKVIVTWYDLKYDNKIDHPPYSNDEHLKLNVDGFDLTSIGFVIERMA